MNNKQTNQQTYTYLEKRNEQRSRNAYLEQKNERHSRNTYSKERNIQRSRNDYDHDNDKDNNPLQKQGRHELNLSVPSSEEKFSWSKFKPKLGEPGGADDPNIIGLSKLCVKTYRGFLRDGLNPEVAIKRVHEIKEKNEKAAELHNALAPNLPTSANGLLKLANISQRRLRECNTYCHFYELKGKGRVLFKYLFHEKGMSLEAALQKTQQIVNKNTDGTPRKISSEADGYDIDLLQICLNNNFKGERKNLFLRLVKEDGHAPEEAKNIVLKQIKEAKNQKINNSNWSKTDRDFNTTSQLPNGNTNVTPITDREDLKLRVALLPKDYPQQKLGDEALRVLENVVIEEVARGWEVNLLFKSINYGDGMLLVDCGNTETVQWLIFVTPKLKAWKGIAIIACMEYDLPMPHTVSMCLPNSAGQNITTTLTLFNSRNAGLNTKLWKLLNCRDSNKDQLLMFGIDQRSFETIKATGNIIHYGFGSISVQLK